MKRSATFLIPQLLELGMGSILIRGYGKKGRYVCRLEVNGAGIEAWTGRTGNDRIGGYSWERLVELLKQHSRKHRAQAL